MTLAKFYGVSADYLLGLTESKNHSNTDLDDLHLSDNIVKLLSYWGQEKLMHGCSVKWQRIKTL